MIDNLLKLTKKKLEELGRENGVELDRRKSKAALVEELEAFLCKCGKTENENGLCDGSHNECDDEVVVESKYPTRPGRDIIRKGTTSWWDNTLIYSHNGKIIHLANTEANQEYASSLGASLVSENDYFIVVK
tara:strand:- start:235 stop:630 length:396 start_codon:yes stop_codon:yes gene_type:complete